MSNFKLISQKLTKLIVVLGPTAIGKTELAIKLAKKFNGEILSADSRQVYREMDIGTAKPPRQQETRDKRQGYIAKGVPHYMIDIVNPDEEFNVAIYKKLAIKAIKNIQERGKLPFLVGGTGLYIQAIVDNIDFPRVPAKKELREKLEKKSNEELFKIYKKLDSLGAKFIDKENKRRLIRAIEVCKATKKPFWQQRKKGEPFFDILQIGIKLPKTELKKRIEKRVKRMFKLGLEKEVKDLVEKYGWNISSMQTIGYQEWQEYFNKKINEKELREKIILHTLQLAKRQITWFKRGKRIHWVRNYQRAEKLARKFLQN
ncbi:tRNA (adenosine(37)-N6)-dimethylallyltransferase MiaA [Patescibacteria group bacterium]|nr:tRNA (adenosine(37)-N6)-dimethylallyltransferase MiaA [Patescibacteria group bacterium]